MAQSRPRRGARRGNLILTSFIFVTAIMIVFAGLGTVLRQQLNQSLTVKDATLARTQAGYLAEMGVNELMYQANHNNAFPTGIAFLDFTSFVAMTRQGSPTSMAVPTSLPTGTPGTYAWCWVMPASSVPAGSTNAVQVHAQLKLANDAQIYEHIVEFACTQSGSQWNLTSYKILK